MKIPVSHGYLEAALRRPQGAGAERGAAVVCHPHPLHGGTMNTKAVFRAAQALSEVGIVALRFNFRGVGASTGTFDGGVGERDDVRAAVDWLESSHPGLPIIAGGFSFGSLVALYVGAEDSRVVGLLGLGLPIVTYDFSFLASRRKPTLVVQGALDQFGPAADVKERLRAYGDHITVVGIDGADHFFNDRFDELRDTIRSYFTEGPGALVIRNAETAKRPW
ncbi:MAG: alpha/beta hydrolase [Gemmatimonadetes bacterium]|nr:alpha/beta hydrolase [Gemmatimonadota bacterium]